MMRSLRAALQLFLQWEVWVLVCLDMGVRSAVRALLPGADYGPGFVPFQEKAAAAASCTLLAVSAVLLFPMLRGGRGLDLRFLARNFTTLLAGAAIALAAHVPISFVFDNARTLPLPDLIRLNNVFRYHWVLTDLGVFLCAWYVHGRLTAATGGRPPGPRRCLAAGLVTGGIGLILPGMILAMPQGAWDGPRYLLHLLGGAVVPIVFLAWFYGALDEGRTEEPTP